MKPQVIGIPGSPIKNSNTDRLIKEVLKSSDLPSEFVKLSKINARPCIACLGCKKDNICKVKDDFPELAKTSDQFAHALSREGITILDQSDTWNIASNLGREIANRLKTNQQEENLMKTTLAFDVYGTLIDTNGVVAALQKLISDNAEKFSKTWRDKQLEYSFRRGLMQNYESFAVCTSQALDYTCAFYKVSFTDVQKAELLGIYRVLPAFDDVKESLTQLKAAGFRLYAFSNGKADALEMLLNNAGIRDLFLGVVSVDDIKTFKPSSGTYCHFLRQSEAVGCSAWLISSNPFDVIGAISAGMKAAWIHRSSEEIFDPWGIDPTITVNNLFDLADGIKGCSL